MPVIVRRAGASGHGSVTHSAYATSSFQRRRGAAMNTPEDVVRGYFAAFNSSDVDGIVALFADDAVVMAHEFETATGTAQIRAAFEGAFARVRIQETIDVDRIVERGELAVAQTHSTGTLTVLESGTTLELSYRELFVLRRLSDGWRITDYMFNSAAPASP
jgi:uncharacterized protein (TIGR02246 family)